MIGYCPTICVQRLRKTTTKVIIVGVPAKIWTENLRIQVRSITAITAELLFRFCVVISCRNLPIRSQFWVSIGHWALLRNLQLKKKRGRKKEGERHCLAGFIYYVTESASSGKLNFDISGSLLHFAITTFICFFFLLFLSIFE